MLNELQQLAFDRVVKEKAPLTYLTGSAGCGKSYTAKMIIDAVPNCIVTASTHKAKTVLSELTGKKTFTTHSYFGFTLVQKNYKQRLEKIPNYKPSKCQLLIIDEVSILDNKILTEALNKLGKYYNQLLILGDAVQLPAVSNQPNLVRLEPYKIELTEQMRQSSCSLLAEYLERLRHGIKNNIVPSLYTTAPDIVFIDSHKEFCRQYIMTEGNKRILAYRNTIVDKYNSSINQGNVFNPGDIVIINKPIGSIARNQDIVTILDVKETDETFELKIVTNNGDKAIISHYKSVSKLNAKLEKLKTLKLEDSYWDLFNSSFRVKHIYASTVHKAQGDSINTVFLDAADIISANQVAKTRWNNPISEDLMMRLLYVGISRMKSKCYIYTGGDNKGRNYSVLSETVEQAIKNSSRKKIKPKKQKEEIEKFVI